MARVAIVIAVSENRAPLKSLAACAKDGEAFSAVLKETGRFDEILTLSTKDETASKSVTSNISALVDRFKDQIVDEVVFYFSWHGDFVGNEFYHILSDYEQTSRNQTALANTELDGLIRSLNPGLFAKIVDACYSGTSYIKSDEDLGEYLKSSKRGFKDAYFLYSSQNDERSWTDGPISAFTKSLLEAIARQDSGIVRYRDLINAASDYFEASGKQTPQFVTQASFTEVFCSASPQMRTLVGKFLPGNKLGSQPPAPATLPAAPPSKSLSLVERVKQAEAAYCSREQATGALRKLGDLLASAQPDSELDELYAIKVTESDEEPDNAAVIGDWLEKRADNDFFAVPSYRAETYKKRVPKRRGGLLNMNRVLGSALYGDEETELIDATRQVVAGYRNTAVLPFDSLTLRLDPKLLALAPEECVVAVIASRTQVQVFWSLRHFRYSDWDTAVRDGTTNQWSNDGAPLGDDDAIARIGSRILEEFMTSTRRRVSARWPDPDPQIPILNKLGRGKGGMP